MWKKYLDSENLSLNQNKLKLNIGQPIDEWTESKPVGLREIEPLIGICISQSELWPKPAG